MISKNEQPLYPSQSSTNFNCHQLIDGTDEEINHLLESFDIPRDFLSSGLDKDEVARFENFHNDKGEQFTLLVIVYPYKDDSSDIRQRYQMWPVSLIFNQKQFILSSSHHFQEILQDFPKDDTEATFESPATLALELFWIIARRYIELIKELESLISELEHSVLQSTENEIFYQLMGINRGLINYLSGISGNQELIGQLKEFADTLDKSKSFHSKLHDVLVEQNQAEMMIKRQKQYHDKINDILGNVVNNNMNNIMKLLTLWSIILTIPTIISGIWGMNIPLPGENTENALLIISLITILLMAVIYWIFKKNKWF